MNGSTHPISRSFSKKDIPNAIGRLNSMGKVDITIMWDGVAILLDIANLDIFYWCNVSQMFGGEKKKSAWKMEYEDAVYKIYDWNRNLAAYFFPNYPLEETTEKEDEIIDELNKSHQSVSGGSILFPMVKLNILDKEEGVGLDYTIFALEESLKRVQIWNQWLLQNNSKYEIVGNSVYTSREDREMLSIALGINSDIVLGEKEILAALTPLLDGLHDDGLL